MNTSHAAVIAIVTNLGYLYCAACADGRESCELQTGNAYPVAVKADNCAYDGDACDGCGKAVR